MQLQSLIPRHLVNEVYKNVFNFGLHLSYNVLVPNTITNLADYSKTENSISFRLSPPYPPTGEISEYSVEYCYYKWLDRWNEDCQNKIFKPTQCKLWPTYHCFLLEKLVEKQHYDIKVQITSSNSIKNIFIYIYMHIYITRFELRIRTLISTNLLLQGFLQFKDVGKLQLFLSF